MGNTCSLQRTLRFKNFVLAAYPKDPDDEPVREALGKLQGYIARNPERISAVCRKMAKLLAAAIRRNKLSRVIVTARMLRELIAQSDDVSGFVPHTMDICSTLLLHSAVGCRIGAADVLTVLCYKLAGRPGGDQSCRLIADNKDKLLQQLENMSMEEIEMDSGDAQRYRYAAIVALANIAFCLHGRLTSLVNRLVVPFVRNLFAAMRGAGGQLRDDPATLLLLLQVESGPFDSVTLPTDPQQRGLAYTSVASWGVEAVVRSVSATGANSLLQLVTGLIASNGGWSPPAFASMIFRSITRAMESRPQRFGFAVCQHLSALVAAPNNRGIKAPKELAGIICALVICADEVHMTGGRPQVLFKAFCNCADDGSGESMADDKPRLRLLETLLRRTYRHGTVQQLYCLLGGVLSFVKEKAASEDSLRALRVLGIAAPFVRALPLIDRGDIDVAATILPFLSAHNEAQVYAAQVLVGLIAGVIPQQQSRVGASTSAMSEAPPQLVTDERDIVLAKNWVLSVLASGQQVTRSCAVEVGRVVEAVARSCGAKALPFVLSVLCKMQALLSAKKKNVEPQVAWARILLTVLANCGSIFELPQLSRYAAELQQRRTVGKDFCVQSDSSRAETGELLHGHPANCPPVPSLIEFDVVADIIAGGGSADTFAAFDARDAAQLRTAIKKLCTERNAADIGTPLLTERLPRLCRRAKLGAPSMASLSSARVTT